LLSRFSPSHEEKAQEALNITNLVMFLIYHQFGDVSSSFFMFFSRPESLQHLRRTSFMAAGHEVGIITQPAPRQRDTPELADWGMVKDELTLGGDAEPARPVFSR
jgi:hypothetical protein